MFEKSFPIRCPNHIRETSSFKVFSKNIPNNWLIREISERDYGIDALIELVNPDRQVTGEFISIQLKSKSQVKFDSEGKHRNYSINKSTTNYWLNSNFITLIFLIDESSESIFIKSPDVYAREQYARYCSSDNFYYDFHRSDEFSIPYFLKLYSQAKNLRLLDSELLHLESIYGKFCNLYENRIRRDFHLLVDEDDVLSDFFYLLDSTFSLCKLLDLDWEIPSPRKFVNDNPIGVHANYGDYYIYEYHMTKLLLKLDKKIAQLISAAKSIALNKHHNYWINKKPSLVAFLSNVSTTPLDEQYWNSKKT